MRLFIGIALPEKVRNILADDVKKLQKVIPGRYVPKNNYHITLVFIGEINQNDVASVKRAMETAVEGQQKVELRLGYPGYFQKKENVIFHMKVDGWKQLWDLDNRLRDALKEEGISFDEKPFRAHITLARKARIDSEVLKNWEGQDCAFCVNEITLFHSTRVNGALTYLPIEKACFVKSKL